MKPFKHKYSFIVLLSAITIISSSCHKSENNLPGPDIINSNYSNSDTLQKLLDQYTHLGLPGAAITVYSAKEGYWEGSAGFASLETGSVMKATNLQFLQSVSKTYMAVAILQLVEQGKLKLDDVIAKHLPQPYLGFVAGAETITLRQLLNHRSGLAEYTDDDRYVSYLIAHPDHRFTSEELIGFIAGKPLEFQPGSHFEYRNTNYALLALIADAITGDHAGFIRDHILNPLRLVHTFYRDSPGYPELPGLVDSYLDRNGNGGLENISLMQQTNVASMIGDDGVISSPRDAVNFLRGLFEGRLLSAASMNEIQTFVRDEDGNEIYSMGLYAVKFSNVQTYGHGGSGIGAACGLYYIPSKGVYVFFATNVGTILGGPIVDKVLELKAKIMNLLVN